MDHEMLGPWRRPRNTSADEAGSIHDDHTAKALGFEGGTIAGSIHMEQFTPLLLAHFGDAWWESGSISAYFRTASVDDEPVRAALRKTGERTAALWMETEAGARVLDGTASLGPDPDSEITRRLAAVRPARDLRMLEDVVIGWHCSPHPTRVPESAVDARLAVITEDIPAYHGSDAFGGRVVPMAPLIHAFRVVEPAIAPVRGEFVGLFGAIEVAFSNGPVVAEKDYEVVGEVLAVSESPRTEILWYRATMKDPDTGRDVAVMTKMDRLLKETSPLWEAFE